MTLRQVISQRLHGNDLLLAGALGRAAAWHGSLDIVALNADQRAAISRVHADAEAILRTRLEFLNELSGQIDADGEAAVLAGLQAWVPVVCPPTGNADFDGLEAAKQSARGREVQAILDWVGPDSAALRASGGVAA